MTAESLHEVHFDSVGNVELWTRTHLGRFEVFRFTLHCRSCGWDTYGGGYRDAVVRAEAHRCETATR